MSSPRQPSEEHQVGVTSAQERNPDAVIADLTRRMNAEFHAGRYADAGRLALEISARSKDELTAAFHRHGVTVLHLDHEAFGIYEGQIEPTYDVHVDGRTDDVLAAAAEFGRRHAQEMALIAKKVREGETDPNERNGLTITHSMPMLPCRRQCGLRRSFGNLALPAQPSAQRGKGRLSSTIRTR